MRYYSFRYSIICYGILGFLMRALQRFSPKSPEPLRWMWHNVRVTHALSCKHIHCASQRNPWQNPLSIPMYLHLSICTRWTPNPSGPYYIQTRDTSGQWQGQRNVGGAWRSDFYGIVKSTPSLTSKLVTLTCIHTSMNQWQCSYPGGKRSKRTSTVIDMFQTKTGCLISFSGM